MTATANGASRADAAVGAPVTLAVEAEVPAGTGTVIAVQWDFDGTGAFPWPDEAVDGTQSRISSSVTHAYDAPGTYFPAVRVTSHREGDTSATSRRVENLGRCRVVVTG